MNDEVEVTWGRVVKVWWSLVWRGLALGMLAGFGAGFIIGFAGAIGGMSRESIALYSMLAGGAAGIPVGMWVLKGVLRKRFSDFRLALISTS